MSVAQAKNTIRSGARQQLIAAAEQLFAESGIDAVSLRQINVAAGQKNSSAAHYHFGSKQALILAIYSYRMEHVNQRRIMMLEQIEQAGKQRNIRNLIEAIVCPIVAEIDADSSGRHYIRFMAQAIGHPQLDLIELWQQEYGEGLATTLQLLRAALPDLPEPLFGQRFGLVFEQIVHSLADREKLRRTTGGNFKVDSQLFVSNLVDVISGSMTAPVSAETRNALKKVSS